MNDYWHIPRASLSPSSASSAVSSASSTQRSTRSQNKQKLTATHYRGQQHEQTDVTLEVGVGVGVGGRRHSEMSATTSAAATAAAAAAVLAAAAKRGSTDSTDSNNSTSSDASSSLLLTADNLERITEIHKKQFQQQQLQSRHLISSIHNPDSYQISNANQITTKSSADVKRKVHQVAADNLQHQTQSIAVINIEPDSSFITTKDFDTVSIASSMHFTMVNGETGGNKTTKKGLCDRGRQVTVLILTMSTIFLLFIIGLVYALELRAREMPQS